MSCTNNYYIVLQCHLKSHKIVAKIQIFVQNVLLLGINYVNLPPILFTIKVKAYEKEKF